MLKSRWWLGWIMKEPKTDGDSAVATPACHHLKENWINLRLQQQKNHGTTGCYLKESVLMGVIWGVYWASLAFRRAQLERN